ncbi:MAG: hypothetical protein J0M18_12560 [Ignavibacteria bacterium]|jgi:hypothetical protein|nr:hypothetical protein [Ignavibacteria bacterium]
MAYGKNTKRIRLFGGNDLQIYFGAQWQPLGHMITGTLEDKTDSQEITFADGNSINIDGKRRVTLSATLAQTSKEELELIDELRSGVYAVSYNNGVIDGKKQLFYFPQVNIVPSMTLKSPDNPQNIVLEMSVQPQESNVVVTTEESMPTGGDAPGTITSKNKFYAIIEKPI